MITKHDIGELWVKFAGMYGHRWTSQHGLEDDGTWWQGLRDLTVLHLARGVKRCYVTHPSWPPTNPEFRDMCRVQPEDLGLPRFEDAYREAVQGVRPFERHQWSHPVVYHAAHLTGAWNLRTLTEDKSQKLFRADYEHVVRRYLAGEDLETPPSHQLTHDAPSAKRNHERVLMELDHLRAALRKKK